MRQSLIFCQQARHEMTSSLFSLVFPSAYHGRSSSVLASKRACSERRVEVQSWRAHATAKEESSSDAVKSPPSESLKSKEADHELSSSERISGKGFGPRSPPPPPKTAKPSLASKDKKTVRRPPPIRPVGLPTVDTVVQEQNKGLVVGLTVLGVLIFIEGITLASSGFLPDEQDAFIVKYVYPAFTPTVGLFLAGAVLYGVLRLRQGVDTDKTM